EKYFGKKRKNEIFLTELISDSNSIHLTDFIPRLRSHNIGTPSPSPFNQLTKQSPFYFNNKQQKGFSRILSKELRIFRPSPNDKILNNINSPNDLKQFDRKRSLLRRNSPLNSPFCISLPKANEEKYFVEYLSEIDKDCINYIEFESDEPKDKGGIGEIYEGIYKNKIKVAVKLIGIGTVYHNKYWKPKIEDILSDPKNEVKVLKKFNNYFDQIKNEKRHIIRLIDSGEVKRFNFPKKEKNCFSYILIMEMGEENFYQKITREFEKNVKNIKKYKEKELIKILIEPI
ncbi:hypothetical protein Mgra_00004294, partial [Meloidogyne graminicola]